MRASMIGIAPDVADDQPDRAASIPALSVVLFSGTDDRLDAASSLIAGAARTGRRVDVLLQFWALEAFRRDRIREDHGWAPEALPESWHRLWLASVSKGWGHWSEALRQSKELGDLSIQACARSMSLLGLTIDDLDPLVDGVEDVAAFMACASGPITFI